MNNSKIEWTDHTDNIWHGCEEVSPGCDHCYAKTISVRWGRDIWGGDRPRMAINSVWKHFQKQQKEAAEAGKIRLVFVGSMMDIFEKSMPLVNAAGGAIDGNTGYLRDKYFNEIVPATPNLLHLMLTKRPSNITKYIPSEWINRPLDNVMYGTSPVNNPTAERIINQLIEVPGKHFLSCEPLIGPITLRWLYHPKNWRVEDGGEVGHLEVLRHIQWLIAGGESGTEARPMHPEWPRILRDQCKEAGVPFFFKQWGSWQPVDMSSRPLDNNEVWIGPTGKSGLYGKDVWRMRKVGKHNAGNVLDGKTHQEFPV